VELERLIETEQRNEAALRKAREEAGTLVRAARSAATDRVTALAGELEAAARESDAAFAAEREQRLSEIREAARRNAERYDAVPDERIQAVVPALVTSLITGGRR
jgi:vacuolar-type H+-ATPase subunit H